MVGLTFFVCESGVLGLQWKMRLDWEGGESCLVLHTVLEEQGNGQYCLHRWDEFNGIEHKTMALSKGPLCLGTIRFFTGQKRMTVIFVFG